MHCPEKDTWVSEKRGLSSVHCKETAGLANTNERVNLKQQQTAGATGVQGMRHGISSICLGLLLGMGKE